MRLLHLWTTIGVMFFLFGAAAARALTIVENGKPVATIVAPGSPDRFAAQRTASEIRKYIRKATGAELAMVLEPNAVQGAIISVGHTDLAEQAGITTDHLKLDGCRLVVKGNVLFLIGRDTLGPKPWHKARGTDKAGYTFLENFLGIRWFIPAPQGKLVPTTRDVSVPDDLNEAITSGMAYVINGPYPSHYPAGYVANNSYEKVKIWSAGGESWANFLPLSKYFKDHPEYFALIGGKRTDHDLNYLCLSNPEVRNLLLRGVQEKFDEGFDWVQLSASDAFQAGLCECPGCEKLDTFRGDTSEKLWENPCERVLELHKWIADECMKSHPAKTILMTLYSVTTAPSKRFDKYPDNVVGEIATGSFESFRKVCEGWKGKVRGFTRYIYWDDASVQPLGMLLEITPSMLGEQMRYMGEVGIDGFYIGAGKPKYWGLWGPVYYAMSKLIDNTELDPDVLVEEYCLGVYGESGAIMKGFFDCLYSRIDDTRLALRDLDPGSPMGDVKNRFLYRFPPRVVGKLDQMLTNAETKAETEKTRKWLSFTRDYFDYIKTMSNTLISYEAYRKNPSQSSLATFKKYRQDFELYRERIVSYAGDGKDSWWGNVDAWFPNYPPLYRFLVVGGEVMKRDVRGQPTAGGFITDPITWTRAAAGRLMGLNEDQVVQYTDNTIGLIDSNNDGVVYVGIDLGEVKSVDAIEFINHTPPSYHYPKTVEIKVAADESAAGFDVYDAGSYTVSVFKGNIPSEGHGYAGGLKRQANMENVSRQHFLLAVTENYWGPVTYQNNTGLAVAGIDVILKR